MLLPVPGRAHALKALSGEVNVVVEGIAASAASVIMCAGDTVTVYPGSLVMIHGVSVYLWDSLNIQGSCPVYAGAPRRCGLCR